MIPATENADSSLLQYLNNNYMELPLTVAGLWEEFL